MKYKIKNIPRYLDHSTIKNTIAEKLNIPKNEIKLIHKQNQDYAIISLTQSIDTSEIQLKNNRCKISPYTFKKQAEVVNDENSENIDIRNLVTPLWKTSYNDQILKKQKDIQKFYKMKIEYYGSSTVHRNNCQFGVGFDENNEPCVGFRSKYNANNPDRVFNVDDCVNVSFNMKNIARNMTDELRKIPEIVYNELEESGYVRNVMIRESGNEYILLIQIHDDGLIQDQYVQGKFAEFYPLIAEFISKLKVDNLALQFQSTSLKGFKPSDVHLIRGNDILHVQLDEYTFEISFFTFFQVNIEIASKICEIIKDKGFKNDILLDLCCGSAFFGIMLNKYFKKVIGVEINSDCIKQAHINLKINNIENYTLKQADVEKETFEDKCSIILDPPRGGVSKKTIRNIRANEGINEIFFICCAYKSSYSNIEDLCRAESKTYTNERFVVESVCAFDMFPNTGQSEVLIHLVRK